MNKNKFLERLKEKIFVLDGAMGTMLQKEGFTKGCPDELNVSNPEMVKEINRGAVKNVREACPGCLVVGNIGPLGEFIEPLGKLIFVFLL